MLTANQELWLQALESGEFKQTVKFLQDGDAFCCLGVACIVAEKAGVVIRRDETMLFGTTLAYQEDVASWLGLRYADGGSRYNGHSLVGMNDDEVPFKEIAATIRRIPDAYFVPGSVAPSPGVG